MEFVDFGQVGEDAGQLLRVQHRPHLLEEDPVKDPQRSEVGHLGGVELCQDSQTDGQRRSDTDRGETGARRTVDDSLSVRLPGAELCQELRRNRVLPVLSVAELLLQHRSVW